LTNIGKQFVTTAPIQKGLLKRFRLRAPSKRRPAREGWVFKARNGSFTFRWKVADLPSKGGKRSE
jgi:hypothetical protein